MKMEPLENMVSTDVRAYACVYTITVGGFDSFVRHCLFKS